MPPAAACFFGDDWDDDLDARPTLVRSASRRAPPPSANDVAAPAQRRPASGVWIKRAEPEALPVPLVVRRVDPAVVLAELRGAPRPAPPVASERAIELLPWEIELVEDVAELRARLAPPSWAPALPVLQVRTPHALPRAARVALALLACAGGAALGFFGGLAALG